MAAKINVEHEFARQDTFRVHPDDVITGRDSRVIPAANQDDLDKQRAVSILNEGQIQPVPVRRDADNRLVTIAGNTRHRAVKLILTGFTHDGVTYLPDPDAKLWVAVQKLTAEEAFDAGVAENRERNDATDLQEAFAQDVYRTERGLNDTEISKIYGYTNTNRVAALKKLLACDERIKQAVHAKKLSLDAGLKLQAADPDKRAEILDSLDAGEEVTASTVRKATDTGKRNVAAFKNFVKDAKDNVDKTHEELLTRLEAWFAGKIGDAALWNTLNKYTKGD